MRTNQKNCRLNHTIQGFLWLLSLTLSSCTNPPYRGDDLLGADEFVLDSYKLREGKFSILEMEGRPLVKLNPELLDEYTDQIEEGDVLSIALYHTKRKDLCEAVAQIGREVGFAVQNGQLILPDLPPIRIVGLTIEEARDQIQKAYSREIHDIEVFLAFKERLARRVDIAGLSQAVSVPVDGRTRLFDVLAQAKVPVGANLFKSYCVRDGMPLAVDMYRLMSKGDMSQNIVMRGGDKLYIADPSSATAMVMGEVNREGPINLPSGLMPLREALARADGIQFTGDKGHIQIFRGNLLKPKLYNLNWKHIIRLPTDSLLIMPGDIVFVSASPITEWNRFISQLLPAMTFVDLFSKNYDLIAP